MLLLLPSTVPTKRFHTVRILMDIYKADVYFFRVFKIFIVRMNMRFQEKGFMMAAYQAAIMNPFLSNPVFICLFSERGRRIFRRLK